MRALPLLAALALLLAACGDDGNGVPPPAEGVSAPTESAESPTATAARPRPCQAVEAPDAADWPRPNHDLAGSRATFASGITAANVRTLERAWAYELPGGGQFGIAATTPVIRDGVVYLGDLRTNVHAIDLRTGNRRWLVEVDQWVYGPSGVAVHGGCVYANHAGRAIAAYRAADGERLWSTDILDKGGLVNFQPVVAGDTVLAATSSLSQPGARGTLYGLDAVTGAVRWSFDTIVSGDLWGHPDINSGGGAWHPPAVDLDAGVAYWGTSNPYPFPGTEGWPNGTSRPGDNRWTDSILAIGIDDGELRWGRQHIAHDIFDRDAVLTGIAALADGRTVVISTGKMGRVIGLDPDGAVLWDTSVGIHQNDDLERFEGKLEVMPGAAGGVVTPIAVAEGTVYVSVVNAPTVYDSPEHREGSTSLGVHPSQLIAIDAATGDVVWDAELPGDGFGGATVVNDLVFTSVITGLILALDRASGDIVWRHQAPGGINGWPAVAGDTLVVPVGYGQPGVLYALRLP